MPQKPSFPFQITLFLYDSVVILALPLVTLTPSCLARETLSIRFFEETACAILEIYVNLRPEHTFGLLRRPNLLSGVGLVVHEEEVKVAGVVDEEDLVAGWGQVLGLLVAAIANLLPPVSLSSRHRLSQSRQVVVCARLMNLPLA